MNEIKTGREEKSAVRLRRPERRQIAMVVQCRDDLVGATHPVRMVAAVVEKLDVSRFCEPIKAREGVAGRDATDPEAPFRRQSARDGAPWVVRNILARLGRQRKDQLA